MLKQPRPAQPVLALNLSKHSELGVARPELWTKLKMRKGSLSMLPMDPSNVVKAVAHHSEIKGCHGGIVSGSRTMWTTSMSETIRMTISKERYGEGRELHDQRPALTPVGHGEQNILTRLTMCFATRMDLTLRAKSNKTESQKPTSWPYSEQDVLSIWLPDQQDAVTMASTDVLDAAQWAASHSPIALVALVARECPNKIQQSKDAAVGIQYDSLEMSIVVANFGSRSLTWINSRMKHPVKDRLERPHPLEGLDPHGYGSKPWCPKGTTSYSWYSWMVLPLVIWYWYRFWPPNYLQKWCDTLLLKLVPSGFRNIQGYPNIHAACDIELHDMIRSLMRHM